MLNLKQLEERVGENSVLAERIEELYLKMQKVIVSKDSRVTEATLYEWAKNLNKSTEEVRQCQLNAYERQKRDIASMPVFFLTG